MAIAKPKTTHDSGGGTQPAVLFLSREWLEPRKPVAKANVERCEHCEADHTHLRRISCWEWFVPKWGCYEGGYLYGCLSCLKEGRVEWKTSKPRSPLAKDGGW